ncbi:MAG TPA: FecR domain-containing protein [Vicinamibacterales bacterium]|nr:FecR domain-containing protein [Vicinamibacterales bacterium]
MSGRVEHAAARRDVWNPATPFQTLFVDERVRTLVASRASILFIDEMQVKLNAGATLTVTAVRGRGTDTTVFELLRGEGWFRSKRPGAAVIRTPAASAAIRGTEIDVAVGPDDTTVLTVVEGSVDVSNAQGSIVVNAGEEATARPGQAPVKRTVLNPDDAVQWTLFYPTVVAWQDLPAAARASAAGPGFARLQSGDATGALAVFQASAGDPWGRIGASMAYLELSDPTRAYEAVADPAVGPAAADLLAQRAAAAMAAGDVASARASIDAALTAEPSHLRALLLLSSLELTRNRKREAMAAAERALAAHADSVGAQVAAAEAAQAAFDLPRARRYLDRALQLDPDDLRALANRARIRFGAGDTRGAGADVAHAVGVAPGDAQVRSLRGFIHLAAGRDAAARADLTGAAQADPEFAEPHLGLGLLDFKERRAAEGLLEMLTATLLDPQVALYHSYLAKAYYQLGRFDEAFAALASAKRLDPLDPTPWLYASLFERDHNRHVAALRELQRAIALNDNRVVYRSRFLLDRDLATKNVSLAEVYRQLGLETRGQFEAVDSVNADMTNAAAHLFLSQLASRSPDRFGTKRSEELQYLFYAPVNRNSFNNFAEYTALLDQPYRQARLVGETGNAHHAFGSLSTFSGNDRFAHSATVSLSRRDGLRADHPDEAVNGFFQGKIALTSSSDLFLSASRVRSLVGDLDFARSVFGADTSNPVVLSQFNDFPDGNRRITFSTTDATLGFKRDWRPGSTLTALVAYSDEEYVDENPDAFAPLCSNYPLIAGVRSATRLQVPRALWDAQLQQVVQLGPHQLIAGAQISRRRSGQSCDDRLFHVVFGNLDLFEHGSETWRDRTGSGYVRDEIRLSSWAHASAGLRYQTMRSDRLPERYRASAWSPLVGLTLRPLPSTAIRFGAFRDLDTGTAVPRISPTQVAGFSLERSAYPSARTSEANLRVEHSRGRVFLGSRFSVSDVEIPLLDFNGVYPEADTRTTTHSVYGNAVLSERVTVFADNLIRRISTSSFAQYDNQLRLGATYTNPHGFIIYFTHVYVPQWFERSLVPDLPSGAAYNLTDFELMYEFAKKRGFLSALVTNAFDRPFGGIIEGNAVPGVRPYRRVTVTVYWRL